MAVATRRDLLRRAFSDDASAPVPRLGSEINDPIRLGDQVKIVLDDHDRMAGFNEALNHFH